jgi:hypothetical protein
MKPPIAIRDHRKPCNMLKVARAADPYHVVRTAATKVMRKAGKGNLKAGCPTDLGMRRCSRTIPYCKFVERYQLGLMYRSMRYPITTIFEEYVSLGRRKDHFKFVSAHLLFHGIQKFQFDGVLY